MTDTTAPETASPPTRPAGAFSRLEWMIAGRYLRARRAEGAISVIAGFSLVGIMLGVATLIIVMAVMNGFRAELVDRILGAQAHISVLANDTAGLEGADALAVRLAEHPDVTRAAPMIEGQVMASSESRNAGALIRGLATADFLSLDGVADPEASAGDPRRIAEGVAVGEGLARRLGLSLGDQITLISPRGLTTPFGVTPRIKSYEIVYLFRIGSTHFDDVLVFMPLEEAQIYFRRGDRTDGIEVMVTRPDEVERIGRELQPIIGGEGYLWNWQRANGSFLSALAVERNVMFLILTLIILVAALNIISGLIMLVKDKGSAIGILRTIGISRGGILRIFFICGASIGVIGTVLGVILGVLFVTYIQEIQGVVEAVAGGPVWDPSIRYLTEIPAVMHLSDVLLVCGLALVLSFLATWYPAWRAARLDPVEALRHG